MLDMILWVVAACSLTLALIEYAENQKYKKAGIKLTNKFTCQYNDLAECYGMCCNYCTSRKECDWCCGGDSKHCDGFGKEDNE